MIPGRLRGQTVYQVFAPEGPFCEFVSESEARDYLWELAGYWENVCVRVRISEVVPEDPDVAEERKARELTLDSECQARGCSFDRLYQMEDTGAWQLIASLPGGSVTLNWTSGEFTHFKETFDAKMDQFTAIVAEFTAGQSR